MFKDDRGQSDTNVFPELSDGQINISKTFPGVVRAFHRHQKQTDHWYILKGQFQVVLATVDETGDHITTLFLGPGEKVIIPPNVWHGFKVLGNKMGTLLYWVTEKYDASNPDEERSIWTRFSDWSVEYK